MERGSANEKLRTVACGFLMNLTYGNGKLKTSETTLGEKQEQSHVIALMMTLASKA